MSSVKLVRVSYLEHNKILEVPPRTDDAAATESDLEVLEREFRRKFLADQDTDSLKLTVTFQKFDHEWDEYIDINSDATINHKDKLKAIVSTPSSSARTPSSSESGSSSDEGVNKPSLLTKHSRTLESEDGGDKMNITPTAASTPCRKKRKKLKAIVSTPSSSARTPSSLESDSSSDEGVNKPSLLTKHSRTLESEDGGDKMNITPTAASTPCRKKRKMRKTDNDSVPLSDPFPLPKHYRADVETALKLGKMTKETRSAFLSSVAGSMLNCKRYPTKEDYICVARSVIKTYPFMASPAGRPYGAIVTSLVNRFKNFRRTPVPKKHVTGKTPNPKKTAPGKQPGITTSPSQPVIPPGEDSVSFARHTKALQSEYKKTKQNNQVVSDLMRRTFALRREDILSSSYDLDELFIKFPYLQDYDMLMQEMELIIEKEDLRETSQENWKVMVPKILQQATLEAAHSGRVASALENLESTYDDGISALLVLPLLLPDVRVKADSSKIIYLVQDSLIDVDEAANQNKQLEPYILFHKQDDDEVCLQLVTDRQIVMSIEPDDIPLILMSAFFAFNICYPRGASNFYAFLEVVILGFPSEKASPTVNHLLTSLNAV